MKAVPDTPQLKLELAQLIASSTDSALLQEVYQLLQGASAQGQLRWNELSAEEQEGIKRGLEAKRKGQIVSHTEAMRLLVADFPDAVVD